jgi:hypothetical protein
MKTFTEFVDDEAELNESIIRTAAIASFASASRQHANKLETHAKNAIRALQRPKETDTDRLQNIESALTEIANALIESRHQNSSHIAMNLSASLLMSRAMKDVLARRR